MRLRVAFQRGVEVIVPKGYDVNKVPTILGQKSWVRTALEHAETQKKFFEPEPAWRLPLQIRLQAIGLEWHVNGKEADVLRPRLTSRRCVSNRRAH